jgi:hypothetical protein
MSSFPSFMFSSPPLYYVFVSYSVLPESVKKKIDMVGGTGGLEKYIAADQRPPCYGGTSVELGRSEEHLEFVKIGLQGVQAGKGSDVRVEDRGGGVTVRSELFTRSSFDEQEEQDEMEHAEEEERDQDEDLESSDFSSSSGMYV